MEGESLGGRWWVLRFKKGGGKAEQISRLCVKVKLLLACASPSLRSINSCIIIIMGGCGWGSPPPLGGMVVGGQGGVVSLPTLLSIIPLIVEVIALIYGYYFR